MGRVCTTSSRAAPRVCAGAALAPPPHTRPSNTHAPPVQKLDAAQQLRKRGGGVGLAVRAARHHRLEQLAAADELGHEVDLFYLVFI